MYNVVGGINLDADHPGYKHSIIAPQPGGGLTRASARIETTYGPLASSWTIRDGVLALDVTVPPNTSATVRLPGAVLAQVNEGKRPLAGGGESPGIHGARQDGASGTVTLDIGSGEYHFAYPFGTAGAGDDASKQPIKVLVVTATQGFRHTDAIAASKERLKLAEATSELRFDFTEDPSTLTASNLAKYDVLFFDNSTLRIAPQNPNDAASRAAVKWPQTGVAHPVAREQQEAIAAFVRDGKGLVAVHSGVDAFYGWAEYRDIVGGGLFLAHPFTREARVIVEDPKNPAVSHFGPRLSFKEEYYYLDHDPRPNSHVLLSLYLTSVGDTTKTDPPLAFIRRYCKRRFYVNVLCHFAETWARDDYLTSVLQGIRIAAGRLPADFGPPSR